MVKSFHRRLKKLNSGAKVKQTLSPTPNKICRSGQFCHIQSSAKQLSDWTKGPLIHLLSDGLPVGVSGDND